MTTQQFLKGLLMAIVAVAVSYFTTSPIDYLTMGIAAVAAVLVYLGKNFFLAFLNSDSPAGSFSWKNVLSALFVLIGNGLVNGISMYVINGVLNWDILLKVVLSITFSYFGATVFAPPYSVKKNKLFV